MTEDRPNVSKELRGFCWAVGLTKASHTYELPDQPAAQPRELERLGAQSKTPSLPQPKPILHPVPPMIYDPPACLTIVMKLTPLLKSLFHKTLQMHYGEKKA